MAIVEDDRRFNAKSRTIEPVQRIADLARKSGRILSARASIERNDACVSCAPVGTASRRQQVDLHLTKGCDEARARSGPPETWTMMVSRGHRDCLRDDDFSLAIAGRIETGVGAMRFRSGTSHQLPARNGAGAVRPAF
jgi:hypothetical protein